MATKKQPEGQQQDKQALLKMALLAWSHTIFTKADQVCSEKNAYAFAGRGFYMSVLGLLESTLAELDKLEPRINHASGGCTTDDECPEGYICDGGECVSPAPPGVQLTTQRVHEISRLLIPGTWQL